MTIMNKQDINIADAVVKAYELVEKTQNKQIGFFSVHDSFMQELSGDKNFYYKYPRNLIFKLTSACNLRCKHCFFYDRQECYDISDELSDLDKINLINYFIEEVNIMHCTLTGGEIFTSSIIFNVIEALKKQNIPIDFLTNGVLINANIVNRLTNILNPKFDVFQISLDGADAEVNDKIRGNGSFIKTVEAIKLLKKHGFKVFIALTLNAYNVNQLRKIYELCKELGVDQLNIGRMLQVHETHNSMIASTEEIIKNLAKIYDIYDGSLQLKIRCLKVNDFLEFDVGRKIFDEKLEKKEYGSSQLFCTPHHDQVAIFPNGNVSLCYDCDKDIFSIGNLKKKSFNEIWENRFLSPLFTERIVENSACKNCKYISFCNTGCIFRAIELRGTINAPGMECKYFNDVVSKKGENDNN